MQYKPSDAVKNSALGVVVHIHVVSQSHKTGLDFNVWEPRIKIKVTSPPVNGKANEEVTTFFKNLLGNCEITSGRRTPRKTLLVKDCKIAEVVEKIEKNIKTNI
jgi:uncharacterized protein (TIGR00251 family)